MNDNGFERLLGSMKRAAGALRDAEVPFALGGGLAVWARGGPRTEHDVDFFVKPEDAQRAQTILTSIGMRAERPPEGWLARDEDGHLTMAGRQLDLEGLLGEGLEEGQAPPSPVRFV